ncbi:unnamed protein product, partial [Brassica rapa subsp. narinosa]
SLVIIYGVANLRRHLSAVSHHICLHQLRCCAAVSVSKGEKYGRKYSPISIGNSRQLRNLIGKIKGT